MQFTTTINPKWGQYLAVLAFALSSLALAGWWQDLMTAKEAAITVGGINWVVSVMNFALHGMPAPPAQPAPPPASRPLPAIMLLLAGGALLGLLWPNAGHAQKAAPPPLCAADVLKLVPGCQTTPDLVAAIKGQIGASAGPSISQFTPQAIADKITKLALQDFVYADALAQATGNQITEPCWASWVTMISRQQQPLIGPALSETVAWAGPGPAFATQAPHNLMVGQAVQLAGPPSGLAAGTAYYVIAEGYTATSFELAAAPGGTAIVPTGPAAGGIALTSPGQVLQRPDPGLVTGIEYISEAVQLLQSNSPIALACAPMAQAVQKDFATLAGTILTGGAAGLFKLPIAIP